MGAVFFLWMTLMETDNLISLAGHLSLAHEHSEDNLIYY